MAVTDEPVRSTLPVVASQIAAAAPAGARIGIAVRLSIAFAGVFLLVVAANLIASRSVQVIHTTKIVPRAAAPTPVQPPAAKADSSADAGAELAKIEQTRNERIKEYWKRFEQADSRIKAAVDGAWKIFGRVLARQSLVNLSRQMDEIRRSFINYSASGGDDKAARGALLKGEAEFSVALQKAERSLARAQGEEWMAGLRTDFSAVVSLRASLMRLDEQRRKSIAMLKERAASEAAPPSRAAGGQVAPVTTTTEISALPEPQTDDGHSLIAWLSAGVLVMVLIISVATVMSIVGPVQRILAAIRRIANGETHVRVPRGGIRELDVLASALNRMAEQLSDAQAVTRNYQAELEARVEERTRQLQYLAEHDPLTQLPNRRQLFSLLNAALEQASDEDRYVGIFFMDVDNFKNINDSMGHAFGDQLLLAIARRLCEIANRFGFAARLGGDEFTVIYADAPDTDDIREAGLELVRAFQKPLPVDGRDIMVSISVGMSIYPEHERGAEALLRAADAALFRAKALGRSQLTVFTPELLARASSKFTIEQGLRHAIERGEFELMFQPEIAADTSETALVEALLRWRQPDGTLTSPGEFLTIAEESGLITQINDWVLRAAIETAARWHRGAWPDVRVAINVSPRQLFDTSFVERVQDLLKEYNLPPRCIELELTETVLQTGATTIETLRRLRAHGVAIALDDFGTGYSSLASLQQLPLTRVKLDRSLIASIDTSERSAAIARTIIALCQSLGLEITAEGIERPEQLLSLLGYRGMYLQGFLLSRPVSADELLPVRAAMQGRMESLLLSIPVQLAPPKAEPVEASRKHLRSVT